MRNYTFALTLCLLGLLVLAVVSTSPSATADYVSCIVHDQKQDCGESTQLPNVQHHRHTLAHQVCFLHGYKLQLTKLMSATLQCATFLASCGCMPCTITWLLGPVLTAENSQVTWAYSSRSVRHAHAAGRHTSLAPGATLHSWMGPPTL
jgi:hypothetical protein